MMDEPVIQEEYKGHMIEIFQDDIALNPRDPKWMDNLGTMVAWYRGEIDTSDEHAFTKETALEYFTPDNKDIFYLPLYVLDHSGLRISTGKYSCDAHGWDTSFVGWIYVTKEKVKKEWGVNKISKKLEAIIMRNLHGEVEALDQYLSGDVYGYQITDPEGDHIDSCYGFYGHECIRDEVIPECKKKIDGRIKKQRYFEMHIQPVLM